MRKAVILLIFIIFSSSAYSAGQKFRSGIFFHYTVGERIWGPNHGSTSIPAEINTYNTSHGFTGIDTFKLTGETFPADETNNEWYRWREIFENTRSTADIRPYIDANKFIMLKTNYFASDMSSWGSASDTADPTIKSVYNYKWHWRKIIEKMRVNSDKFFVIWTNAPFASCPDSQALLVHYFCKWAKDTLAAGRDTEFGKFPINVYVFDYFHKVTDANSNWKLKLIYQSNDNPNYPDSAATALVAPALITESFNAILNFENYFNPDMVTVPVLVSPNDTAKNVIKNVTLRWRKVQFATRYSIQIALDTGFTSIIESDNSVLDTFYTANNLYFDRKYYWRVKCFNYGGSTNWSLSRSFTTVIAPPGTPGLVQPGDEQTNTPVKLYFTWSQSAPAAEKYRFQIGRNVNFSSMVLDSQNITATTILVLNKLDSTTTYYWRVKGINIGGESLWSEVWSFSTVAGIPSNFTLLEPQNNTINVSLSPQFKWNESARATRYIFQLASDDLFVNLVNNDSTVTDTTHTVTPDLTNDITYYWRVKAINSTGGSLWSQTWAFHTIKAIPDVPVMVYPVEGNINVPLKPKFLWNETQRAESYSIQVAHDSDFTTNIYDNSVLQDTFYLGEIEFQREQVYWWRLKARNFTGESNWTTSTSFTTLVMPPAASIVLSPKIGDTAVPVLTNLIWNTTPGAESYNVQISNDFRFLILYVNKSGITDTTYTLPEPLDYLKEYYWRVKAKNIGGEGPWSEYANFITESFTAVDEDISNMNIQVTPVPFRNIFELKMNLPAPDFVSGSLYSINGEEICNFISKWYDSGEHNVNVNLDKYTGIPENGILICKLRIGNKSKTIKLIRN
ncbi:MAG: fibronectin type III domain-containing protein [Ignavibacteriae bacterium]|nr:fibronectin type III domain-containing protein [Ignavibacteriota bacterium]